MRTSLSLSNTAFTDRASSLGFVLISSREKLNYNNFLRGGNKSHSA